MGANPEHRVYSKVTFKYNYSDSLVGHVVIEVCPSRHWDGFAQVWNQL